ncbi:hypothetical protein MKX01_010050 [Papaver californicum]|nr:hypothetical protein MKX01_010050 [Papaver californicum]
MHDWLIFLLPMVIEVVLNVIEPFHRFVGQDMMTDLMYPLQGNTVPFWGVSLVAILLPMAIIAGIYFYRRDVYDWHQAILVLTDAIKDIVGRPRPVFFWRCFPNGNGVFDTETKIVQCIEKRKSLIRDTKASQVGILHSQGRLEYLTARAMLQNFVSCFFPCLLHLLREFSRVDDYCHHWQDVFAGGLLGKTVASICYLQFFPPPYDTDGWEIFCIVPDFGRFTNFWCSTIILHEQLQ